MMRRDHAYYLQCIHERAIVEGGMVEDYYQVISRQDEIKRYWWVVAGSQIDVHKAMASRNWVPPIAGKDISGCVGAAGLRVDGKLSGRSRYMVKWLNQIIEGIQRSRSGLNSM